LLEKQEKLQTLPETDILEELRNITMKIPLLQAIKKIPIYAKTVRDMCNKKNARKKKDPQTIQVIGHLANLLTTTLIIEKYVDPGILIVTTSINNLCLPNTLIDLGVAINMKALDTMKNINI